MRNSILFLDERNNTIFTLDQLKIIKLGSLFIAVVYLLNILMFKYLFKVNNQPIFSSIKASTGVIILGVLSAVGIELLYNLNP